MPRKKKNIDKPEEKDINKISKINRFNILYFDLQAFFTILTVILVVWYFFNSKVLFILKFVFSITMLIIGINNKKIYERPMFAYICYAIAGLILIDAILTVFGI